MPYLPFLIFLIVVVTLLSGLWILIWWRQHDRRKILALLKAPEQVELTCTQIMKQAKLLVSPDSILQEMEQEGLITTRRVGETTIGHMLRSGGSEQSFYRITDLGRKT